MAIEETPKVDDRVLQAPHAPFFGWLDPTLAGPIRNAVLNGIAAIINAVIIYLGTPDPTRVDTWPAWLLALVPVLQIVLPIIGRALEAANDKRSVSNG